MAAGEAGTGLAGCHVLVTRPAHQAHNLCALIEQAGGQASLLPVIEIAAPGEPQAVEDLIERLERFDIAIFVSSNAVHRACALVAGRGGWPATLRFAVVGQGSAAALAEHGLRADIHPLHDYNSEGLLALDELQRVAGRRVIIFRGEGGRELLADTLRARGAEVAYAEVYRRTLPPAGRAALQRLAATQPIDAIVVTSNDGLHNLWLLAGDEQRAWLRERQLVVISDRAVRLADELGFHRPARRAAEASDEGLLEAIRRWWRDERERSRDRQHAE